MPAKRGAIVAFDLLLKAPAGDVPASAETIDQLRPSPANVESCVRWLGRHGAECHRTGFGVAGEMPVRAFEKLFHVKLGGDKSPASGPPIPIPEEIASYVDQITVTPRPEMFG
jgi:hypothetical protein